MCSLDGSSNYAMVLHWSNRRARDHRNHVAPRRKPIPASERSQLTKTLLWTCKLFQNQTVFSQTFICRSVGISRICRLKKFQNPTVHGYRSYCKESAYAVSEEIELQKQSNPPHHENKNEEQMETWRAHQSKSLRDRRAIEKPEAVIRHSEESQRRKRARVFHRTMPLFPWVVEGTSFAWGLKKKHSAAICHSEKTPEKGIPTLIKHPPAKRTHRYWSTARDRQRAETTRTFFFVEKTAGTMSWIHVQACSHGQLHRVV